MTYESPTYRVEDRIGDVELRLYQPYLVAETLLQGTLERVGSGGFRRLAGYIFGGNATADGSSTKIAMTTPVTQDRVGDEYRVRFMMPSNFTADSLPTPTDSRVSISEVGPRRLAAIRYSGRWSRAGFERHLEMLSEALADAGYSSVGEPIWARYDPPWTPWFMRRNEVLIPIADPSGA